MQIEGREYLYAFDEGFDVADDMYRLDTATNPYDPSQCNSFLQRYSSQVS